MTVDGSALEAQLKPWIKGEVRFDAGSRGLYATDASNYRQVPIGVVVPKDVEDVLQTLAACREAGAPVLPRGGGTSLAGQCCNVAVVLDFSKYMHDVIDVNPDKRSGRVEPGVYLDDLNKRGEVHEIFFAPDPSTHDHCTLGGMIGNNSCGKHSVMAGRAADNVQELEVITYDGLQLRVGPTTEEELAAIIAGGGRRGEIYRGLKEIRDKYADRIRARYPTIPRRVSGYNLDELLPERGFNVARALVGTEGTCAITLEATVDLIHKPKDRAVVVVGYPDVYSAADHAPEIMNHEPMGLEGVDDILVADMKKQSMHLEELKLMPDGNGWLFVEFGDGSRAEVEDRARELAAAIRGPGIVDVAILSEPDEQEKVWKVREAGLGASAFVPGQPDAFEGWEDSAAPPHRLGDYLRALRSLFKDYGYKGTYYGHFGDGCVHTRITFDMYSADGVRRFRSFVEDAADLVISFGGSMSGEHGDGQSRAELLGRMFGDELVHAFREFKTIWDPDNKMNPGKVVDPYRIDENLRLGADYHPWVPETHFSFRNEGGSFERAANRCVGIGLCRKEDSDVMCPSYMVTREEMHSTRGRARLLFEMLQGDPVSGGWRDHHVKEALDLCLACKGCKSECPVNVDMATYKAEFYSHYYRRRLRPRVAYAMGLIYWWARAASKMPRIANFLIGAPVVSRIFKTAGGIAPERNAPSFATLKFRRWFRDRAAVDTGGRKVVLWPDTFNTFFHVEVAKATVEVLEGLGYSVKLPDRVLCCGRPLYDFGMLPTAKRLLRRTMDELNEEIAAGTPIVGIEPSCVAVFRDELANLFPDDTRAYLLATNFLTVGEFVARHGHMPWSLKAKALMHPHCHHTSVMGIDADMSVLESLGVDVEETDAGCCGLAGSFGYEAGEKYEVSVRAGERKLAPLVRSIPDSTLIVTDGFSCRTQIEHLTGRRAMHLSEVLRMAMNPTSRRTQSS